MPKKDLADLDNTQANDRLEAILNNAGLGVWDLWVETNEVVFDRRWCEMLGLDSSQFRQDFSTLATLFHPDDIEATHQAFKDHMEGKTSRYESMHRLRHANGSWLWILDRGQIVERKADGSPIRFTGTHFDITNVKNFELLARDLQKAACIGGWELNIATGATKWTDGIYKIHDTPIGTPTDYETGVNFFATHEQSRVRKFIETVKDGVSCRDNFELIDSKAKRKWVELIASPVFDASGKVIIVSGTMQDITKQKKVELDLDIEREALAKNQSLLTNTLATLPVMVFAKDINKDFNFTLWNKKAEKIIGISAEECIGKNDYAFFPKEQADFFHAKDLEATKSHETIVIPEETVNGPEGAKVLRTRKSIIRDSTGKPLYLLGVSEDITLEAQARNELLRAKNHLSRLIELIPTGIFELKTDLTCTFANDTLCRMMGIQHASELNSGWMESIHPEDRDKVREEWAKSFSENRPFDLIYRFIKPEGQTAYLHCRTSIMREPDGNISGYLGSIQDLTDQIKIEERLRQTLAAVNESALVAVTDRNGRITEVNQNFCNISGYNRDELIGHDHRMINSGVHPDEFFDQMWSTISSKKIWSGEICNKSKTGRLYFVQTVISPILSANGDIESYLAIRFDVTKAKESERMMEEAQQVAKIGSWSFDLATKQIKWTKQMYKLFDQDPTFGPPTFEQHLKTIHPDDLPAVTAAVDQCVATSQPYELRFRSIFPNHNLWLEARGEAQVKDGVVTRIKGTCQDISELVIAEDRAEKERAKSVQSAKLASLGEMSAGIAHEINNPLAIISGAASLLERGIKDSEALSKRINAIKSAADRIAKIVNGLRKFSRSSEKSEHKRHSLRGIIEEAIILTSAKVKRHDVALKFDSASDARVLCDEIEIEQVLVNLINNAVDAMKDSEQRCLQIILSEEKTDVVLQVRDTGQGISVENQKKLFQPFFTTKPVGEGTGLGLSIVKGILDEHHASVELLTEAEDTCFEIRFNKQRSKHHAA